MYVDGSDKNEQTVTRGGLCEGKRWRQRRWETERVEFKVVWFPNVPSLVGAGFHAAVLQCAAAAAAWDSCQRYFGVISDRFAKDTRLRALLYISLV